MPMEGVARQGSSLEGEGGSVTTEEVELDPEQKQPCDNYPHWVIAFAILKVLSS